MKSDEALAKINRVCRAIYGAPLVFLICNDERQTWKSQTEKGYSTGEMDCSIVYAEDPAPNPNNYRWWYFCDKPTDKKNKDGRQV